MLLFDRCSLDPRLATRNKNYAWILRIIDVYSRYVWAFALKCKSQAEVYAALNGWLQSLKETPKRMTSDAGTEFTNKKVQRLFKVNHVEQFFNQVGDKTTTGLVERFNRTLRELMGRNFSRLGKLHWVQHLSDLVHNYNHSLHRTMGATPHDIWTHQAAPKARHIVREAFPFKEGSHVRILLPQGIFEKKAGAQRWSSEIYTIVRREGFKYVLQNEKKEEVETRYRPSYLKKVHAAELVALKKQSKKNPPAVAQRIRKARQQHRLRAQKRRLDNGPRKVRRSRLRPSTLRQRLRTP